MAKNKQSSQLNQNDKEQADIEAHRRAVATNIQHSRTYYWLVIAAIPIIVSLIIVTYRYFAEANPSTFVLAVILIIWFTLRIFSTTSVIVNVERSFVETVMAQEKPIKRIQVLQIVRQNLDAIKFTDIVFAPLIIFSLALSIDIVNEDWFAVAIGAGWFAAVALIAIISVLRNKRGKSTESKTGGIQGAFIAFLIPAMLNSWWSSDLGQDQVFSGTAIRILFTFLAGLIVVFVLTVSQTKLEYRIFDKLCLLLPARRHIEQKPIAVRNLVAVKDLYLVKEITSGVGAGIALAAIVYWLFNVYPSHWIFLLYNALAVVPPVIAMVVFSKSLAIDGQRFVRRLALQSAAMTLILVNFFLVFGYLIGYALTYVYQWVFSDFGAFPYPDRFYFFRETHPSNLPYATQLESLFAAMVFLFALSWVVYVVQSKAWKEGTYITCLTGFVAGLPYIDFDFIALVTQYLPSLSGLPEWVLAVCIPALKGLFTGDVENLILKSEEKIDSVNCADCDTEVLLSQGNFCPKCGANVSH